MNIDRTTRNRAAVLVAGVAFMLAWAPLSPAHAACGTGQGKGADIRDCTDEIMAEQERTLDLLDEMTQQMSTAGIMKADQKDAATRQLGYLRNSHARGRGEKGNATDEEFDGLVAMGQPSQCEFRLLPRYAKGPPPRPICSDDELAANRCEQVCEFSPDEKARNDQRGLRLEDDLADALEQTRTANDELSDEMNTLSVMAAQSAAADEGSCSFVSPHPNVDPPTPNAVMFHNQLLVVQETITDIGKDACQQDAGGFNGSTACIILDILLGVQKGITAFVTTVDDNYTSAKVDATFDCVNGLKAQSDGQAAQMDDLERKIDALGNDVDEMKTMIDELRSLLLTPQGQRDGFTGK